MNHSELMVIESDITKYFKEKSFLFGKRKTKEPSEFAKTVSIADAKHFDRMNTIINNTVSDEYETALTAKLKQLNVKLKDNIDREVMVKSIPIMSTMVLAICKHHSGRDMSAETIATLKECKTILERFAIHSGDKMLRKIDKAIKESESETE